VTQIRAGRQPSGLMLLFVTEMWERFSYYGMRALLVLFLITEVDKGGFGWSVEAASRLYGWYTGLVYLTPVLGGYLADRHIGTHRAMVIGGVLIVCGHFTLAMETLATFYLGLALVILGTGFFKSNVSSMLGQLYHAGDTRRDAGFTIFYMGINLGALLGPLLCGYLAQSSRFGWRYGFAAAGVGMALGLTAYLTGRRRLLGEIGAPPARYEKTAGHVTHPPLTREERERIAALFVIAFFVIFFWLAFEQAGSSMTVFAERYTDRSTPSWLQGLIANPAFPAAWFQAVNPAFILTLAPFFSWLWQRLGTREPAAPVKMGLGLLLLGGGFACLTIGAYLSGRGELASPLWLIAAYFLHTCGELCLSPVGLSLVTKLAPVEFASMLMGVWFLSSFAANLLGGYLAGMLEVVARGEVFRVLGGLADFFLIFVGTSLIAGMTLLSLAPRLIRMMHGRS
jgi:POT family proton-dependent oligopeptide transporter